MLNLDNQPYFAARAKRAIELAEAAKDPEIADLHQRMAVSYSELARYESDRIPPLNIVNND